MKLIFLLFGLIFSQYTYGQDIAVSGKVVDEFYGKGIKAKISYKSYPTGGISGSFNDSTYTFSVFGSSKYMVMAEADGYIPRTILVDPKDAVNGKIERQISLTRNGKTVRLSHLIFEQGKSKMNPASFPELDELVALMKANEKIEIQLEGHTDNQGNPGANLKLSEDRVEAVKKYMTSKGINKNRIKTKAFGGTMPISTEATEEARMMNRRVEMRVLKY